MRPSKTEAVGCSFLPFAGRIKARRSWTMSSKTPAAIQRCVCWSTADHGGKPLGIMRHCEPVRTIQRSPLNASRKSCSRCGASSRVKVREGATNRHSSSVPSLRYGFLIIPGVCYPEKCITGSRFLITLSGLQIACLLSG